MRWCWPDWSRPRHRGRRTDGGGEDGKQVVFDVGDPQGIDSMSPLIGVTVAAYEAWNIQYATLTDKAAKDFSVIPGLAKSWEGSDDGLTWTYKLRPNMKWSDGKPLTAEDIAWTDQHLARGGVAQPLRGHPEPDGRGARRHHGRDQVERAGPEAPGHGRIHPARSTSGARWTRTSAGSTRAPTASAPARSCSSSSRRASSPASTRTRTTGAASRPSTRSSCASSTTPTRWWPRSRPASSTPPRTSRRAASTSSRRTPTS